MTCTVLVLASTGMIGRRLVPMLEARGATVRAATRSPQSANQVAFDWERSEDWDTALDGVDALFLVPPPLIAQPQTLVGRFLARAKRAGVTRLTLVTSQGAGFPAEPADSGRLALEALVLDGSIHATVLRPSGFMQNFSEWVLRFGVMQGQIGSVAGDGRAAMVDAGDIAAVAAVTLIDGGYDGQILDITGPEAITLAQVAAAITTATGRPLTYRAMPPQALLDLLAGAGLPDDYAAMLLRDQEAIRDGHAATIADTVARIAGIEPARFADFADAAARAGAWAG